MKKLGCSVGFMLIGFIFATVGVQALSGSNGHTPDPFFSNASDYVGQSVSTIEEYGFSCSDLSGNYYNQSNLHCFPTTPSASYSEIRVASSSGIADEIAFTMQKDAVQVGYLILFWGEPEVRIDSQSVRFKWRGGHIMAVVLRGNRRSSPLLPVWKVYFLGTSA